MNAPYANLVSLGNRWDFGSEADLEDFVWSILLEILDIKPLSRQHSEDGQNRYDILGILPDKSLAILELKNQIDDGIIPQLTRYYDALEKQHPFQDIIDYTKPISLIAIAPDYHERSLIEIKYSTLEFNLLSYKISSSHSDFCFEISNYLDNVIVSSLPIKFAQPPKSEIAPQPRAFRNLLDRCTDEECQIFSAVRERILAFQKQIKEEARKNHLTYARGKSLPLAEIRLDSTRNQVFLALYLPLMRTRGKRIISRRKAKLWLQRSQVTDVGFALTRTMNPITHAEWIERKYPLFGEKSAIRTWVKHRLVIEQELEYPDVRKRVLEKYNWEGAEWGFAFPIEEYKEHLKRNSVLGFEKCQTIWGLLDIAFHEFSKKTKS